MSMTRASAKFLEDARQLVVVSEILAVLIRVVGGTCTVSTLATVCHAVGTEKTPWMPRLASVSSATATGPSLEAWSRMRGF